MKYTDIINAFNNRNKDRSNTWTLENITGHGKLTGDVWEVKVVW